MMECRINRIKWMLLVLLLIWLLVVVIMMIQGGLSDRRSSSSMDDDHYHHALTLFEGMSTNQVVKNDTYVTPTDHQCTYWNCIDSTRCFDRGRGTVTVYIYNVLQYVNEDSQLISNPLSKEYVQLLWALSTSKFAVKDPSDACLLIPSVDILNGQELNDAASLARVFAALPLWKNGSNHLLFSMWTSETDDNRAALDMNYGKALLAAGGFTQHSYRDTFDISIPFFNPYQDDNDFVQTPGGKRDIYLISSQIQMFQDTYDQLVELFAGHSELLLLNQCGGETSQTHRCSVTKEAHSYPRVLTRSRYCLITQAFQMSTVGLHDMLRAGCVPVVAVNTVVMPFREVLDWKRAAVFINDHQLSSVLDILNSIDSDHNSYENLVSQGKFYYDNYFKSMSQIAFATLEILTERVLPHKAKSYTDWNRPIVPNMPRNPFLIPLIPSEKQGFTAIVLAYDRIELMRQVVRNIGQSKHVAKIIIIWNNQNLHVPSNLNWPSINVPITIIESKYNRLSNRFYPYAEISTDCVLTIDDDIIMVPADELDFAYRVWVENPDRLVGFPPRYHTYNASQLRYESEWMSNISMVLTGVAFYHKYYHYLFTSSLPAGLKHWVDDHINCEDVAMNYLIANVTGKAPIKVLARKKFKMTSSGISAGILTHLVARNTCMKVFTEAFGVMPLRTVEFRADPVLYKIPGVDESTQWYCNDGAL